MSQKLIPTAIARDDVQDLQRSFITKQRKQIAQGLPGYDTLPKLHQTAILRYVLSYLGGGFAHTLPSAEILRSLASQSISTILSSAHELPKPFTLTEIRNHLLTIRKQPSPYQNIFGDRDRLYFKLSETNAASQTQAAVTSHLLAKGYAVTDYKKGYSTDTKGKQIFKIGRLLKDAPELAKAFETDKSRTGNGLMVVISRHPYDIARMSTGRDWSSCMTKDGINYRYVAADIKAGTVVSYLIRQTDPNITAPISRQLLKPYINLESQETVLLPQQVYGVKSAAFEATNSAICSAMFNAGRTGRFAMSDSLYPDGIGTLCTIAENGTVTIEDEIEDKRARELPQYLRNGTATAIQLLDYLAIPYRIKHAQDGIEFIVLSVGDLDLSNHGIQALPSDFSRVVLSGILFLNNNQLTTLKGAPQGLRRLYANNNRLTTLEGAPQGLHMLCADNNQLTTLKGVPQGLHRLYADNNQLTTLEGVPQGVHTLYATICSGVAPRARG